MHLAGGSVAIVKLALHVVHGRSRRWTFSRRPLSGAEHAMHVHIIVIEISIYLYIYVILIIIYCIVCLLTYLRRE